MVSQPVKAVILLFPDVKEIAEQRKAEDIEIAKGQPKLDKTIFWIKQTVGFRCKL
jgi:ubiquitin carboxyl-terminal hydrolase L3